MARSNNGAPGIDGVTFEAIDKSGPEGFLKQIREELVSHTYRPMRVRKTEIPKDGGKVRVLSIPAIRDVKCVVADAERMFVSSANLTEQALRLNMALGVLIIGTRRPREVEEHFAELAACGVLRPLDLAA